MQLVKLPLLVIFFTLISLSATAEDCPNIRLDLTSESLASIPIMDQGNSYLCYAYAGSLLLNDYYRKININSKLINPISMATQSILSSQKMYRLNSSIWGGFISHSVVGVLKGVCLNNGINNFLEPSNINLLFEKLTHLYKITRQELRKGKTMNVFNLFTENLVQLGIQVESLPTQDQFEDWLSGNFNHFFAHITDKMCVKTDFINHPQILSSTSKPYKNLTNEEIINTQLKTINPVAINFCSDSVLNPDFEIKSYQHICSKHYAVAVGQRLKNNTCQILMRDSLCAKYNSTVQGTCTNGHYWIDRKVLLKNTKDLSWIEL